MVLLFERNDITKVKVDAIVNAANNTLLGGGGVDGAIHAAAGPKLLEECMTLGGCETGKAKITKGYNLPAKYVIHTVGPIYKDGKHGEKELLESCYENSLKLAKENDIHSIAFPLISAGVYGYPKDEAIDVAVSSIKKFFENDDYDITVKIIFFGAKDTNLGEKRFGKIDKYIDDNYADKHLVKRQFNNVDYNDQVGSVNAYAFDFLRDDESLMESNIKSEISIEDVKKKNRPTYAKKEVKASKKPIGSVKKATKVTFKSGAAVKEMKSKSLDDQINNLDASFSDTLFKIIDSKKLKDSEVYFKANMDRKLFSKIRNGSRPKKTTAISLCIALELSYDETNDLLIKAGYILNKSEKFDVIISYFLKKKNYNIYQINEALLYYDQPQLGVV